MHVYMLIYVYGNNVIRINCGFRVHKYNISPTKFMLIYKINSIN